MMTKEEGKLINLAMEVINRELGAVLDMAKSEGWATAPGGTDKDKEDARSAVNLIRWLMNQGWIWSDNLVWRIGKSAADTNISNAFKSFLDGLSQ